MEIKHRTQLPDLLRELKLPMIAAEVGVAEGFNSADLLSNGIEKLYMVDIWEQANVKGDGSNGAEWHEKNYRAALHRVQKYGEKAIILKGFSKDMAEKVPDESLGLVYLDACHTYECVLADLNAWLPKLVHGGVMAGHDFLAPEYGVQGAVKVFTKGKYKVHLIPENEKPNAGFYFIKN